jgi:hypothetical protein
MIYSYAKIYMTSCYSPLDTISRGHAIWPLDAIVKVKLPQSVAGIVRNK